MAMRSCGIFAAIIGGWVAGWAVGGVVTRDMVSLLEKE
jgi:hypothetical protein